MNWSALLSLRRYGDQSNRLRSQQDETRLGFEVDYDRIIFSKYFRSLQDKTQVMPLVVSGTHHKSFAHTRLTHSLEVSVVARSLGRSVGEVILQRHPDLQKQGYRFNDFGAIVAAAALAHDIGNPPFGHSGEKAIGHFFLEEEGRQYQSKLSEAQYNDLTRFEGNANGFKLLSASRLGVPGSLRLSYATLGAFIKYPKASIPHRPSSHIADKKFGYFQSEKDFFLELARELELLENPSSTDSFYRHPLVYLVEAADDICYTLIDFEDAVNLGFIAESVAQELLLSMTDKVVDYAKFKLLPSTADRMSYLRALGINVLLQEVKKLFLDAENSILSGTQPNDLISASAYTKQLNDISKLSVTHFYKASEVIDKEIAGYQMLSDILKASSDALVHLFEGRCSVYDKLLLSQIPEEYKSNIDSIYDALMASSCFTASLSDSQAIALSKTLRGLIH